MMFYRFRDASAPCCRCQTNPVRRSENQGARARGRESCPVRGLLIGLGPRNKPFILESFPPLMSKFRNRSRHSPDPVLGQAGGKSGPREGEYPCVVWFPMPYTLHDRIGAVETSRSMICSVPGQLDTWKRRAYRARAAPRLVPHLQDSLAFSEARSRPASRVSRAHMHLCRCSSPVATGVSAIGGVMEGLCFRVEGRSGPQIGDCLWKLGGAVIYVYFSEPMLSSALYPVGCAPAHDAVSAACYDADNLKCYHRPFGAGWPPLPVACRRS